MELQNRWLEQFAEALGQAVAGGELPSDTDIDQMVFEITAMMVRANFAWIGNGEARVLEQARIGIRDVLERVVGQTRSKRQQSERRARRALTLPVLRGERGSGVIRSMGERSCEKCPDHQATKAARVGRIDERRVDFRNVLFYNTLWRIL
jgi:hypothetical protein